MFKNNLIVVTASILLLSSMAQAAIYKSTDAQGNVFTKDALDAYVEVKMEEVRRLNTTTHPVEFEMYYSC